MKSLLVILLLQQAPEDIDKLLKESNAVWDKAFSDSGARSALAGRLRMYRHPKLLKWFIHKFEGEKTAQVKETLTSAIADYDNEEAAGFLADALEKLKDNRDMRSVMDKILRSLGRFRTELTRPLTEKKLNQFVKHSDLGVDVAATNLLGYVRHKSSVPILIDRLASAQKAMRDYIVGHSLPKCDGD